MYGEQEKNQSEEKEERKQDRDCSSWLPESPGPPGLVFALEKHEQTLASTSFLTAQDDPVPEHACPREPRATLKPALFIPDPL